MLHTARRPLLRLADLAELPDAPWHIGGHFRKGQLVVLYGPPGACKTFLAMDWALSVANGSPFLGLHEVEQGPSVYVCSEGRSGILKRCDAWTVTHGGGERPENVAFLPYAYSLTDDGEAEEIVATVEAGFATPSLIVVDTLAKNLGGDENSSNDMAAFVRNLDRFRERWECTVVVVAHTGKDATKKERGSSVLRGGADAMFSVAPAKGGQILVKAEKAKDDELLPPYLLTPEIVGLGTDRQGRDRSSLALTRVGRPAASRTGPTEEALLRDAILSVVADRRINTGRVIGGVKQEWPERHPTLPVPGEKKIAAALKAMEGTDLTRSSGPRKADIWERVPQH